MAIFCGTCCSQVHGKSQKTVDQTVSGVSFRKVLSEYFSFDPAIPVVCRSCELSLAQIVKINIKLEKLTFQRNKMVSDFGAKLNQDWTADENEKKTQELEKAQGQTAADCARQSMVSGMKVEPAEDTDVEEDKVTFDPEVDDDMSQQGVSLNTQGEDSMQQSSTTIPTTTPTTTPTIPPSQAATENHQVVVPGQDTNCSTDIGSVFPADGPLENGSDSGGSPAQHSKAERGRGGAKTRPGKPYICGVCNAAFAHVSALSKHVRSHRKCQKWVQCGQCWKTYKKACILETHMKKTHAAIDRRCEFCSEKFTDPALFRAHMKFHRERDEKVCHCKRCPETFRSMPELKKHWREHHRKQKVYLCQWCSRTFVNSSSFGYHCRSHTGEKPHKCHFCGSAFKEASKLRQHLNMHSGDKPYKCDQCPSAFAYPSGLHMHMKTHSGEKPYKCDLCPKAFTLKLGLTNHKKTKHSDLRPYVCEVCCTGFKLQSQLKRHELLHTGVKPFKCDFCPATFAQKGNMKTHMKIHNKGKLTLAAQQPAAVHNGVESGSAAHLQRSAAHLQRSAAVQNGVESGSAAHLQRSAAVQNGVESGSAAHLQRSAAVQNGVESGSAAHLQQSAAVHNGVESGSAAHLQRSAAVHNGVESGSAAHLQRSAAVHNGVDSGPAAHLQQQQQHAGAQLNPACEMFAVYL